MYDKKKYLGDDILEWSRNFSTITDILLIDDKGEPRTYTNYLPLLPGIFFLILFIFGKIPEEKWGPSFSIGILLFLVLVVFFSYIRDKWSESQARLTGDRISLNKTNPSHSRQYNVIIRMIGIGWFLGTCYIFFIIPVDWVSQVVNQKRIELFFTLGIVIFTMTELLISLTQHQDNNKRYQISHLKNSLKNVYGPLYYLFHDKHRIVQKKDKFYSLSKSDKENINKIFSKHSYLFKKSTYEEWSKSIKDVTPESNNMNIYLIPYSFVEIIISEYEAQREKYYNLFNG